jgi:putative Mn2+ efflux pump MntP
MDLAPVSLLAVGLSMDAAAVALARGFAARSLRVRDVAKVALLFGGFQAAMPGLGLLLGRALGRVAAQWDHWIAFVLLAAIGLKMLKEAFAERPAESEREVSDPFATRPLLVLAVATSIDALAAGVTLPALGGSPLVAIAAIGVVTAVFSGAGVLLGHRFGTYFGPRLEVVGGVVLLVLAVQTLLEHL